MDYGKAVRWGLVVDCAMSEDKNEPRSDWTFASS
jgi:hypothetical protein